MRPWFLGMALKFPWLRMDAHGSLTVLWMCACFLVASSFSDLHSWATLCFFLHRGGVMRSGYVHVTFHSALNSFHSCTEGTDATTEGGYFIYFT